MGKKKMRSCFQITPWVICCDGSSPCIKMPPTGSSGKILPQLPRSVHAFYKEITPGTLPHPLAAARGYLCSILVSNICWLTSLSADLGDGFLCDKIWITSVGIPFWLFEMICNRKISFQKAVAFRGFTCTSVSPLCVYKITRFFLFCKTECCIIYTIRFLAIRWFSSLFTISDWLSDPCMIV